ncbi:hypothetical protein QR680_011632 [Steinernema hermaphroditum]|uniref:Uncharacterized protein n=1 Tax=Steinernema hermaphroditum TaxID=289476 RepID=A0AA39I0P7_9BILA|nr:hypothetical protein QR680_011632 [Steinernema hermaphroditum]
MDKVSDNIPDNISDKFSALSTIDLEEKRALIEEWAANVGLGVAGFIILCIALPIIFSLLSIVGAILSCVCCFCKGVKK